MRRHGATKTKIQTSKGPYVYKYALRAVWRLILEQELDPKDFDIFNKFIPQGEEPTLDLHEARPESDGQGTNLADLILQQIAAHEAQKEEGHETRNMMGPGRPEDAIELPVKVVEVYTK